MLMTIFRIYLVTVVITLVAQAMTTARAQIIGIPLNGTELLGTIVCAIIPIVNLIVAYDCLTMMFNRKDRFVYRYMYVHDRINEIIIIDGDNNEININVDEKGDE